MIKKSVTIQIPKAMESKPMAMLVQTANRYAVVKSIKASVNNQQIAIFDARVHGIANNPCIECGCRMLDQLLVQVKDAIYIILCRRWKTCGNASIRVKQWKLCTQVGCDKYYFVHSSFSNRLGIDACIVKSKVLKDLIVLDWINTILKVRYYQMQR